MDIYIQIFELYGLSFSSIYTDSFGRSSLLIIRPTLIKSQSYFGRDEPRDINTDIRPWEHRSVSVRLFKVWKLSANSNPSSNSPRAEFSANRFLQISPPHLLSFPGGVIREKSGDSSSIPPSKPFPSRPVAKVAARKSKLLIYLKPSPITVTRKGMGRAL